MIRGRRLFICVGHRMIGSRRVREGTESEEVGRIYCENYVIAAELWFDENTDILNPRHYTTHINKILEM